MAHGVPQWSQVVKKDAFLGQKIVQIGSNFDAFGTKWHQKTAEVVQKEDL